METRHGGQRSCCKQVIQVMRTIKAILNRMSSHPLGRDVTHQSSVQLPPSLLPLALWTSCSDGRQKRQSEGSAQGKENLHKVNSNPNPSKRTPQSMSSGSGVKHTAASHSLHATKEYCSLCFLHNTSVKIVGKCSETYRCYSYSLHTPKYSLLVVPTPHLPALTNKHVGRKLSRALTVWKR